MELPGKLGEDFDDCLSGTGRGWDDVAHGGATWRVSWLSWQTAQHVTLRTLADVLGAEAVEHLLGGRRSVDGGHHACLDTEGPLQDERDGGEAVGL